MWHGKLHLIYEKVHMMCQVLSSEKPQVFSEYAQYLKPTIALQSNALHAKPTRTQHINNNHDLDNIQVKVQKLVVELLGASISQEKVNLLIHLTMSKYASFMPYLTVRSRMSLLM
jgi:hypothetical protein